MCCVFVKLSLDDYSVSKLLMNSIQCGPELKNRVASFQNILDNAYRIYGHRI